MASSSSSSSSSSRNWVYDVFPSFSGEDVRVTFLSHFLKELDRKLIIAFKDNEIERSRSLDPELKHAIKDSRVAVVVFSKNYASSSWCLNELLEIVKCKEEFGQMVVPIFYGLDPSHVRKQTGEFGKIFAKTCENNRTKEEVEILWRKALTDVANILGYHSVKWDNEATMIEAIANDVLVKLLLTPSMGFENFVGVEDHIAKMSVLLNLECKEVKTVGIWGSSGIGKTTIARILFNRLSRHFQGSVYIDRRFISKSMEVYSKCNPDDYNMKLHLQENFLSKILDKQVREIDHLGAVRAKLKDVKVLIIIDDLDAQVVLDTLVGGDDWFGRGSRIIVITKDKQILRGHGIKYMYEVHIPSKEISLQIFCRFAFKQNFPPDGFMELASEVAGRAGGLPLGLNLLGTSMRGRSKEDWIDMLPRLRKSLNGDILKTLRVSYDELGSEEDKTIFRYVTCFFIGDEINSIKLMLADIELDVNISLKNLVDKCLISLSFDTVEMHSLVEEMGREIVRTQSNKPERREFLMISKDVCTVLGSHTGTEKVIGISLDIDEIDELRIHKEAFKRMRNLRFLNIYTNKWDQEKEGRWHLPEGFNYFPPKLRLLRLDGYPIRYLPSSFRPENLVELQMLGSKLKRLWNGVQSLAGLKKMNLYGSENLEEIPDLSKASNLEELDLSYCSSLVELPSSIQYLHKLERLHMSYCINLETFPSGMNLKSLTRLILSKCSRLRNFPAISTNISYLYLSYCSSLVDLPSSIQYLQKLIALNMSYCVNVETFPSGMNLKSLSHLDLNGCSRLKNFPDISTNLSKLNLNGTGIEEYPSNLRLEYLRSLDMNNLKSSKRWKIVQPLKPLLAMLSASLMRLELSEIPTLVELSSSVQKFNKLEYLSMTDCVNLETLPTGINLESLWHLDLSGCSRLKTFPNISTNMSILQLNRTGIEEVPRWIEDFSNLCVLDMRGCKNLLRFSLNIFKLNDLVQVDFSYCGALSEARWDDIFTSSPELELIFINCFNLDQEALLQQLSVFFKYSMRLSGEEVPSYFTHRTTTGTSLTNIPLLQISLSKSSFRCKACALIHAEPMFLDSFISIQVCCRFIDILGNHFDSADLTLHVKKIEHPGSHVLVFDCQFLLNEESFHLPEVNYDHVDIQFHLTGNKCDIKLTGCGIRISEDDGISEENDLGNETDHSEEYEDFDDIDFGNEIDHGEEYEDCNDSDFGNEIDDSEEYEDCDDFDLGNDIDHNERV